MKGNCSTLNSRIFQVIELTILNSKCRIQYGERKYKKLIDSDATRYSSSKISESLTTNLNSKYENSKWRIQYGGPKYKKLIDSHATRYSEIFKVADYEYELKIKKFKMANPRWRTKMQS